jgi:diguanylate cyclase (GGDEF)-like protein
MLLGKEEGAPQTSMLARAEEIQQQNQQISGRDLQLWSIGILIMLVLMAGLLTLVLPNVVWAQRAIHLETAYLPQLFYGLISLVLLSNVYFIAQKITLNNTRRALISELVLNERLESLSLIDPLTQLLNRRALNELLPREIARANRLNSPLTFMAMDLQGFRAINAKFGSLEGNLVLREFASLVTAVFRGGDMIFRHGGDEFLVVMPDTGEPETDAPLQRLLRSVEHWNASNGKAYEMSLSWGISAFVTGTELADVLRTVDRKMYQKKHNLVPVF